MHTMRRPRAFDAPPRVRPLVSHGVQASHSIALCRTGGKKPRLYIAALVSLTVPSVSRRIVIRLTRANAAIVRPNTRPGVGGKKATQVGDGGGLGWPSIRGLRRAYSCPR